MKLIQLHICYCNMILLDMHTTSYIAMVILSVRNIRLISQKENDCIKIKR